MEEEDAGNYEDEAVEEFSTEVDKELDDYVDAKLMKKPMVYNLHQLGGSYGFFIDVDSVVLFLTKNGHFQIDWSNGGQYAHMLWSFDKLLSLLHDRKGRFFFVVFENELLYNYTSPSKKLARELLLLYLKLHTKCEVFTVVSPDRRNQMEQKVPISEEDVYWYDSWPELINNKYPSFILLSTSRSKLVDACVSKSLLVALLEGCQVTARTFRFVSASSSLPFTNEEPAGDWKKKEYKNFVSKREKPKHLNLRMWLNIEALTTLIAYKTNQPDGENERYLTEFAQTYAVYLMALDSFPIKARCQPFPSGPGDRLSAVRDAFVGYWECMQAILIEVLETNYDLIAKCREDYLFADLMDGRFFWKCWYSLLCLPAMDGPWRFSEYVRLPEADKGLLSELLLLVSADLDRRNQLDKKCDFWISVSQSEKDALTRETREVKKRSELPIEFMNCSILPHQPPEGTLIEEVFPPCRSELLDLIRNEYNKEQEYYYNIVERKVEEEVETDAGEVVEDWEEECEDQTNFVYEDSIIRGPEYRVPLVESSDSLLNFKCVVEDLELYWMTSKKKINPPSSEKPKKSANREEQIWYAWLNRYSASLNITGFKRGFPLIRRPLNLRLLNAEVNKGSGQEKSSKKKEKAAKPGSKKAQQNKNKKVPGIVEDELVKQEQEQNEILQNLIQFNPGLNFAWNLMWSKFTIPKYIVATRMWVLDQLLQAWTAECRSTQVHHFDEDSHPVRIYRLIADTWFDHPDIVLQSVEHRLLITHAMEVLGYYGVARQFEESMNYAQLAIKSNQNKILNLSERSYVANWPDPEASKKTDLLRRTHLPCSPSRFQLHYMGHLMDRNTNPQKDPRTPFYPDDWQKKLLDIIDASESALICAPTSSGKTFASFYLMQRVLTETGNGKVVYVCPTKALVNQGSAEVYRRFKDITLPEGHCLVGTCTREFRTHHANCRVLLTVPQCLDMIMLSSTGSLRRDIEYVIFDEIHCLNEEENGVVWENLLCMVTSPFLALSATMGNMHHFRDWLQSLHTRRVHLIHVEERFSDLQLFAWVPMHKTLSSSEGPVGSNESKDVLAPIHPLSLLKDHHCGEERSGNLFNSISKKLPYLKSLTMTSAEAIQLYDVMVGVSQDPSMVDTAWTKELVSLDPDAQFSTLITISQSAQRQWGKKLLKLFEELVLTYDRRFSLKICTQLCKYNPNSLVLSNPLDVNKEIISLVTCLREQNRLPVLVFNFSHRTCEKLASVLYENFLDDPLVREGEIYDEEGLERIIEKLRKKCPRMRESLFEYLRHGIGVHHESLERRFLSEVELLFRERHLKVVFSTKTLALGVNMPCRSVVFAEDSYYLTPVQYKQMSGRAGRRGYDYMGDVIFLNISIHKIQRVVLTDIPPMVGSFPTNSSLALRMLTVYSQESPDERKHMNRGLINLATKSLFAFGNESLRSQMWLQFRYTLSYLWNQYMINVNGSPVCLAGLANNLSYLDPGNMVLNTLLLNSNLEQLCKELSITEVKEQLLNILSQIVMPLNSTKFICDSQERFLKPLHPKLAEVMELNNFRALHNFTLCVRAISHNLKKVEDTLPYTRLRLVGADLPPKSAGIWKTLTDDAIEFHARSPFVATSGVGDVFHHSSELCHTIRADIPMSQEALPMIVNEDLAGDPIPRSDHLIEFWKHGARKIILRDYHMKDNELYDDVKVICDALVPLHMIIEQSIPGSSLISVLRDLDEDLNAKFTEAYPRNIYAIQKKKPRTIKLGSDKEDEILKYHKVADNRHGSRREKEKMWLERT